MNGLGPLRRVAHRDALNAGQISLLLGATRIGQDGAGVEQQRREVEVAKRRQDPHAASLQSRQKPGRFEPRPRARVEWQHDRAGNSEQELNQRCEPRGVINIGGAVRGREKVFAGRHARQIKRGQVGRRPRPHQLGNVNHHVANQ